MSLLACVTVPDGATPEPWPIWWWNDGWPPG